MFTADFYCLQRIRCSLPNLCDPQRIRCSLLNFFVPSKSCFRCRIYVVCSISSVPAEFVWSLANQVFTAKFVLFATIQGSLPNCVVRNDSGVHYQNCVVHRETGFAAEFCWSQRIRFLLMNCVVHNYLAFSAKSVLSAVNLYWLPKLCCLQRISVHYRSCVVCSGSVIRCRNRVACGESSIRCQKRVGCSEVAFAAKMCGLQ